MNISNSFLKLISKKFGLKEVIPIQIPRNNAPCIYKVKNSKNQSLIMKILRDDVNIIGEETEIDIIFDSFISDYLYDLDIYKHKRTMVDVENFDVDKYKYTVMIQSFISGRELNYLNDINVLELRFMDICRHLVKDITKTDLINYSNYNVKYANYVTLIQNRINNLDKISFMKHFINDIKRSSLKNEKKDKLSNLIAPFLINDKKCKKLFIHADLKHKNIIIDDNNNLTPIDWSASHFGDPLIDIADIIVSQKDVLMFNDINKLKYMMKELNLDYDNWEFRIRGYIYFKIFSIARIFLPKKLEETTDDIIYLENGKLDLNTVLSKFIWLRKITY